MSNDNEAKESEEQVDKETEVDDNTKEKETEANEAEERAKIVVYIEEMKARNEQKTAERRRHDPAAVDYPDESFFARLDSSIKKNTALVKKLKNMTEPQRDVILKDLNSLNLSRYVSELAAAIVEVKIKVTEIPLAVKVCSTLHLRYRDFSAQLRDAWTKSLPRKPGDAFNASKMRTDVRMLAELLLSGVLAAKDALPMFGALLTLLITGDKVHHANLNILLSFGRQYAVEFADLVPRPMRILLDKFGLEVPASEFLPSDRKKGVANLLKDYYGSLVEHVVREHKQLARAEKELQKALVMKGEVGPGQREAFESRSSDFHKLWAATQQFADVVDEECPVLKKIEGEDDFGEQAEVTFDLTNRFKGDGDQVGPDQLWEDEETRTFYVHLPDLKELIPAILYKDSLKEVEVAKSAEESPAAIEMKKVEDGDVSELVADVPDIPEDLGDLVDVEEKDELPPLPLEEERKPLKTSGVKTPLEAFLGTLPNCVNRDHIDKAALYFATTYNTKNNRKKLVEALLAVHRTRLDLLPFYGRFVAQLVPIMPVIGEEMVTSLRRTFYYLFRSKNQINYESKMKNVRFIAELVKFGIFPKAKVLEIFRSLLSDFHHHQIDMTCALFETCGQYLYRTPESHPATKVMLEKMMRLKAAMVLDLRYTNMIENVFFMINPPEGKQRANYKEKPVLHLYIEYLIYDQLGRSNISKVLRQLRRLNWTGDKEVADFAVETLSAAWNVKYDNIVYLAQLLVNLHAYQSHVVVRVIDNIVEDIRLGIEMNMVEMSQRRLAMARYLAECYNLRLIDSGLLFRVLYSIIVLGVDYHDVTMSPLDSANNLMRLRLVAIVFGICGRYLATGSSRKKLDYFLFFLQRYYWLKKNYFRSLPESERAFGEASLDMLFKELISEAKPRFKVVESYEAALKQLEASLRDVAEKAKEMMPNAGISIDNILNRDPKQGATTAAALEAIKEEEEWLEDEETEDESALGGGGGGGATDENESYEEDSELEMSAGGDEFEADEEDDYHGEEAERGPGPKVVKCAEDDEFQREFDRMLNESLAARSSEVVRSNVEIAIPIQRQVERKLPGTVISGGASSGSDGKFSLSLEGGDGVGVDRGDHSQGSGATFSFKVLTRNAKSNKPQLKPVAVASDSDLVQNLLAKQKAAREEKLQYKQLILDINQRSELQQQHAPGASTESGQGQQPGSACQRGGSQVSGQGQQQRGHDHQQGGGFYRKRQH